MGNAASAAAADARAPLVGGGAAGGGGASNKALLLEHASPSKSWAVTDHSLSAPWSFLVKEEVQCLCEGGRGCAREDPARQRPGPNALPGLHSSWVGDAVLAMARPWQEHVVRHELPARFRAAGIACILNLQEVGEHDACGPGNLPGSGFSYAPEAFMAAGVSVVNLSWRDMGVPSLDRMMDVVQVMQYATSAEGRRVAVHCHAGLGRTGLAIACFLVASGRSPSAAAAVDAVRAARPGALQTGAQVLFVSIFEQWLRHLRCTFRVADPAQLSLGNSAYVVTKVCRRISRSMTGGAGGGGLSTAPSANGAAGADALAAAAVAALGPLATGPLAGGGAGARPASEPAGSAAAPPPAAPAGEQPDWASAAYELMSPAEAAALQQQQQPPTQAGPAALPAANGQRPAAGGFVVHARRLSGGSSLKLLSSLRAIGEEAPAAGKAAAAAEQPVHILQTDNAVTEVYGHGLTIIRATDGAKKLRAGPPPAIAEQRLKELLTAAAELGADQQQLPWTERLAIRPEAFQADGWLPEPPASYGEALRRQQRLLHGAERRRCLHLHRLLRAAAKALAAAAAAYNAVPPHVDAAPSEDAPPSAAAGMRRMHSRSRSNAAAIDLLALAAGGLALGPGACGGASTGGSAQPQPAGAQPGLFSAAGLFSKQPNKSADGAAATTAAALLPGIHLGPPGTEALRAPSTSGCGGGGAPAPDARRMSRSNSAKVAAGAAPAAPAPAPAHACLAGCCAPSFAAGLLVALLYRGRFPEEHEAAWGACPRLRALGLGEGHAVCAALQEVKLAANAGRFGPLEAAPGAVAVCVLADWFEGFTSEALSEPTLELLVDEAEGLLAHALLAADARARAGHCSGSGSGGSPSGRASLLSGSGQARKSRHSIRFAASLTGGAADEAAAQAATARSVCASLAAFEQDLCLVLAAVLRHARSASLDDARLRQAHAEAQGADDAGGSGAAARVEAQVDAAMAVLYRLAAGWLLGPLALACPPALEAAAAFLHFLAVDDDGYAALLHASQPGRAKARSGSTPSSPRARMQQARMQQQHQQQPPQQQPSTAKLKARLLSASGDGGTPGQSPAGGGSSPGAARAAGEPGGSVDQPSGSPTKGRLGRTLSRLLGRDGDSASSSPSRTSSSREVRAQEAEAVGCAGALASKLSRSKIRQQCVQRDDAAGDEASPPAAIEPAADARSQTIHGGLAEDLCVRQMCAGQPAPSADEPAPRPRPPGALDSPPRCASPEAVGSPSGRRHLPPLQQLVGAGSDAGSSFAGSPCSSLGSIASLLHCAGQQGASPPASLHHLWSAAQQPQHQPPLSSTPSNCDVASSAALSVSALSELQLPQASGASSLGAGARVLG